jgi:hypothetical protein
MCVSLRLSCCRTVKRRPDPEGVAKFVNELLALLAPAIFDAQGGGHSLGRDADGGQAGVNHVTEAGRQRGARRDRVTTAPWTLPRCISAAWRTHANDTLMVTVHIAPP